MQTGRVEAFSDGVLAILITIMVLELPKPDGGDWGALRADWPVLIAYALSFLYLGIYWNNHHHMFQAVRRIGGGVLWANGIALLAAGAAYWILQSTLIRSEGPGSALAAAVGRDVKGKISPVLYITGFLLSLVHPWIGLAVYFGVAAIWLIPDRRVERQLAHQRAHASIDD